jgi:hypothetical protein
VNGVWRIAGDRTVDECRSAVIVVVNASPRGATNDAAVDQDRVSITETDTTTGVAPEHAIRQRRITASGP